MFKIIYSKGGKAFPDYNILNVVQNLYDSYISSKETEDFVIDVSTINFIDATRVLLLASLIPFEDISLSINDITYSFSSLGNILHLPSSFLSWYDAIDLLSDE